MELNGIGVIAMPPTIGASLTGTGITYNTHYLDNNVENKR